MSDDTPEGPYEPGHDDNVTRGRYPLEGPERTRRLPQSPYGGPQGAGNAPWSAASRAEQSLPPDPAPDAGTGSGQGDRVDRTGYGAQPEQTEYGERGGRPGIDPDNPRGSGRNVFIGVLVALLVVVVIIVAYALGKGHNSAPATPSSTSSSSSSSSSTSSSATTPSATSTPAPSTATTTQPMSTASTTQQQTSNPPPSSVASSATQPSATTSSP